MAKLFKGSNTINPEQTNLATAEQNQAAYLDTEAQSQRVLDMQTEDMILQKQKGQSGNLASALDENPGMTAMNQELANNMGTNPNIDPDQVQKNPDIDDVHRGWVSQFGESFMKGVGESVIGSSGDVINFIGAAIPGLTMAEGNVLGRALRDYGDDMANEHTTYLAKKLEGQELTWGSLIDPQFWSTQGAEMLPMMIEFMATGFGAGSAAKKGMSMFVKGASKGGFRRTIGGLVGEAASGVKNMRKASVIGGAEEITKLAKSGSGLAKHLVTDVDGVLRMSKFSNEFVGAAGAGLSNNLLAGVTNAMDFRRTMQAQNDLDKEQGKEPTYTEEQMTETAVASVKQNLSYAPIDMLSWGISYGGSLRKLGKVGKSLSLKPADAVAKEASLQFKGTMLPFLKGVMKAGGHALAEGTEETFQETYEQWASMKAKEKVTGEVAPDYFDYYFSPENKNTKVASFALGALMGGAMNLKFNEAAEKGVEAMTRQELLRASIHAENTGGQKALEWHINDLMVDVIYGNKIEDFDAVISDQVARGNITPEVAMEHQERFLEVQDEYEKASALNILGKFAMFDNSVKAKSLQKTIANEYASYEEQVRIIKDQFGEEDESLLNEEETARLTQLKDQVAENPDSQQYIDELEQKLKDRSNSVVQKKYGKLKREHEQQIKMLSMNLAIAEQNKLNLLEGKKADPLNMKFWTNQNGLEMAYITDENGNKSAVIEDGMRELQVEPGTMSEGQLTMNQQSGSIIAGLSDKQYEMYVKMTDEEVFAAAEENLEKLIKNSSTGAKQMFDKLMGKTKEQIAKAKGLLNKKSPAEVDEDGNLITPVTAEENEVAEKAAKTAKEAPKGNPNEERELNAYEQSYEEGGRESAAEAQKRREEEQIAEFEARELAKTKYDENGEAIVEENTDTEVVEKANYRPVKDKASGKYILVNDKTGEPHPNGKTYTTSVSAKKDLQAIEDAEEETLGNASLIGDGVGLAWKGVKLGARGVVGGVKLGAKGVKGGVRLGKKLFGKGQQAIEEGLDAAQEAFNEAEKRAVSSRNMKHDAMRKSIMEKAYRHAAARHTVNNPSSPVTKNELDAYLNSSMAAVTYGPRAIDEAKVINRMLRAKGINANVVVADNLFSMVGVQAAGYALAATVYVDERLWHQDAIYMHEMMHVNYRLTQDSPETKAVIAAARSDAKLLAKVERLYRDDMIVYRYELDDSGELTGEPMKTKLGPLHKAIMEDYPGQTPKESKAMFDAHVKAYGGLDAYYKTLGIIIAPPEEQTIINEELFAFYMEKPMAKNLDKGFSPITERRETKIKKGWIAYITGNRYKYLPMAKDIITKLNDNKPVKEADLQNYVIDKFVESTAGTNKKAFTGSGNASLIDTQFQIDEAENEKITQSKIAQRRSHNAEEAKARERKTMYQRLSKKIKDEVKLNMKDYTELERQNEIDFQLSELENSMMEEGAFDDFESAKSITFRGATRILNGFTRSLNYVKRKKILSNEKILASNKNIENMLLDRNVLIAELFNLAFETKGNTNKFIKAIENSRVEEIWQFNQYMEKMYPGEKLKYLSSMGYVMANQQTISAVRNVVNENGVWETQNALSETETNTVDRHLERLKESENAAYKKDFRGKGAQSYQYFKDSYDRVKNGTANQQDYVQILRFLAPDSVIFSELINNQVINMKGHNVNVQTLIDKMVFSKVMENPKKPNSLYVYNARPFIEAIVDSNRKYTSYSVVQNAEGNMEPSKITNNHLLSEFNGMNDFLTRDSKGKFPTFKAFKERYAHLSQPANRTHENPVLKTIYDNAKNGVSRPSVSLYMGLTHLQHGSNSLYQNSNAFAQSIEDFQMFAKVETAKNYMQTLSAMADSPRKFMTSVGRIKFNEVFKLRTGLDSKIELSLQGKRMLERSWKIYEKSNENLKPSEKEKTIKSYQEYEDMFKKSVNKEVSLWNKNAEQLIQNKTIKPDYFANGRLSLKGQNKVVEFVFNQSVNGMALAEIFNPGIPFNEIVKRNKGNSSPINTFGNENLKQEPIIINDEDIKDANGNVIKKVEIKTNSGMYMTRAMAQKIVDAGLGVFDLNNGLKLLNYHVERDNPNFKGKSAYFKGYTTIIDEDTLLTEPGLRGVFDLLNEREKVYNAWHLNRYGKEPSEDLTNGEPNFINYAVPYSAIKGEFLSAEQKEALKDITFDNLSNTDGEVDTEGQSINDRIHTALDNMFYQTGEDNSYSFNGLSTNNFGPQQIMDKVTTESLTPVQFISSLVVNGNVADNLAMGEEIQSLIRKDMAQNLDEILNELGNMDPAKYKAFILKHLDLENMDQGQRMMIEQSLTNLNHPAVADFITNTLANRLKQAGNKLKTDGSIAQQKPNYHYANPDGYTDGTETGLMGHEDRYNDDGSIGSQIMSIVLPNHMKEKVKFRQYLNENDPQAMRIIKNDSVLFAKWERALIDDSPEQKSAVMKEVALSIARLRFGKARKEGSYGYSVNDYIGEFKKDGVTAGWFVRGETVMATRIPSHGPASTGVFEAVDYLRGQGNQVMVHDDFSDVAGSDYDGDSLFIQTRGKSKNFNQALDKTVDLWTSPGMRLQVRAKIEFKETVENVIGKNTVEKRMPMSPDYHRNAYNNTMISKRNIGIIFNTHRLANYLAAYNVKLAEPIMIDNQRAEEFADNEVGQNSRNNQSAMLANIILDNTKWGYADALGLNDQTINQYSLLINLGFSLKKVNDIMNSKAVKVWNENQNQNQNPYNTKKKNSEVMDAIYKELGIDGKNVDKISISTNEKEINTREQMNQIIHLMVSLEKTNADILHVSKIMAGHKGIENNPFILEQQLKDFETVVNSDMQYPSLYFPEGFMNNPDIKAYHENASKILEVMKKANPIYNDSTSDMMESLNKKIGYDDSMSKDQMKRASELIKRFNTARMLGLNNISSKEKTAIRIKALRDVENYREALKEQDYPYGYGTAFDNNVLLNRALNFHPKKPTKDELSKTPGLEYSEKAYLSSNPRFFNESLTEEDYQRVQEEWVALPKEIKESLIVLDLMKNGLTGKLSLTSVFDERTNHDISTYAAFASKNKNNPVSENVLNQLERLIISNEFDLNKSIVNVTGKTAFKTGDNLMSYIFKNNESLFKGLNSGNAMIFKINGKPYTSEGITDKEQAYLKKTYSDYQQRENAKANLIGTKIKPFDKFNGDINLEAISIAEENNVPPYTGRKSKSEVAAQAKEEAEEESEEEVADDENLGNASKVDPDVYDEEIDIQVEMQLNELSGKLQGNVQLSSILTDLTKSKGWNAKMQGFKSYFNVLGDTDANVGIYGSWAKYRPEWAQSESTLRELVNLARLHIEEKNQERLKKKVDTELLGNASVIDFHNYDDVAPLNQREFDVAMEYDRTVDPEQRQFFYKKYLEEKKAANGLTKKYNATSYSKMEDKELFGLYSELAPKDVYAYSIITTPLVMELANRLGVEQSDITGMVEKGDDITLMDSYLNNNNITSGHPVTQGLVRKLNAEYKSFVKERGKYIDLINKATDALYQEKFKLSKNSIISTAQKVIQSILRNRKNVYQELYGNLLSEETYKDKDGNEKKEFKFKSAAEIKKLYNANKLSKAEFEFYETFTSVTSHLKKFDSNTKVRKDYIPHTAMESYEMFANRGLLGLMVNSKGLDAVVEDVKVYIDVNGKKELMSFRDIKSHYNAMAAAKKQSPKDLLAYQKLKRTATKLQKTGRNEDGSRLIYSNLHNETLLGMSPLSRFENSRSMKAELMPSMDLNKALIDYIHSSIFVNGNETFKGFKELMPVIDGVMAYNDKNGFKNAYNYVKETIKEGFIMKKDQITFGKKTDAVISGLVRGNTLYALGYKGLVVAKGLYAIGNLAIGKYMNIKREGGKSWATGEARYWGIDKGISLDTLDRRQRARNILTNLGYVEANFYDEVDIESKTGLGAVMTKIALSPMSATEDWIQRSHLLGMLTEEEFNLFDEKGDYKTGTTQITPERFAMYEERVKNTHGKGYSPTDQSRIHRYALGRLFMQFSKHLPTQIRERFAKEDIDMNGTKYIGSLRQVGKSASDFFHNGMSPAKAKEYYNSLDQHKKEAFMSALRGVGMMTVLGFVAGNSNEESQMIGAKTDASAISSGIMSDANSHFDPEKWTQKGMPPAIRSALSVVKGISGNGSKDK